MFTTRLGMESLEARDVPTLIVNPGLIRGFNPQPEPPGGSAAGLIRGFNPQPDPPVAATVLSAGR